MSENVCRFERELAVENESSILASFNTDDRNRNYFVNMQYKLHELFDLVLL